LRVLSAFLIGFIFMAAPALGADKPIKIGILLELSGTFGTTGVLALHGFQYYLQKQGGKLGGQPIETVIEDSAGDPATAITKVKKLVESDHIDVLVGPINSATGAAIKNYVVEQKIPNLIGSTVAEVLDGKYMFRTSFDGNAEGYLEGYLPGKAGYKKAVLFAPNYLAGQVAEGGGQTGIDLVSLLRLALRTGLEVGEELPVDRPVTRDGAESAKIGRGVCERPVIPPGGEDGAARDLRVEPVVGTDHGVTEAEGGHGELHGHEP